MVESPASIPNCSTPSHPTLHSMKYIQATYLFILASLSIPFVGGLMVPMTGMLHDTTMSNSAANALIDINIEKRYKENNACDLLIRAEDGSLTSDSMVRRVYCSRAEDGSVSSDSMVRRAEDSDLSADSMV